MKIAITGASGYIGGHLTRFFEEKGYEVVPLGRDLFKELNFDALCRRVEGARVVINLAGAPINKRWTEAYKQELYDSRIPVTRRLVAAIGQMTVLPELFISVSAEGYYPASGEYDEYNGKQDDDFLARLCADWEREARRCPPETRLPEFLFRLMYGEGASFLTKGQNVRPAKLLESGFTYLCPTIEKLMGVTDHHTVAKLDVRRYMGRWYEIARYENHFEKGMTEATATYTLLPDGKIRVENEGMKDGVHRKAIGRAKKAGI